MSDRASHPENSNSGGLWVVLLVLAGLGLIVLATAAVALARSRAQRQEMMVRLEAEAALASAGIAGGYEHEPNAQLPQMGDFPDFALTQHEGKPFTNADLAGRVWVLQFFFACCDKSCPTMVRQMAELQRTANDPEVRFVSISIDPDRDTPEGVAAHATRFAELTGLADRSRWSLLTGDRPRIVKLLEDCRLPIAATALVDQGPLGHVDKFFLIDAKGTLRGMYNYDEPERMAALERDLATLRAQAEPVSAGGSGSTPGSGSTHGAGS